VAACAAAELARRCSCQAKPSCRRASLSLSRTCPSRLKTIAAHTSSSIDTARQQAHTTRGLGSWHVWRCRRAPACQPAWRRESLPASLPAAGGACWQPPCCGKMPTATQNQATNSCGSMGGNKTCHAIHLRLEQQTTTLSVEHMRACVPAFGSLAALSVDLSLRASSAAFQQRSACYPCAVLWRNASAPKSPYPPA
jgi:hypothetical protein